MGKTDVVVAFQLSDTGLRSDFRKFLSTFLDEDLTQVFQGEVSSDELAEIKQKAGSIEYEDNTSDDRIIIYENDTLGLEKSSY